MGAALPAPKHSTTLLTGSANKTTLNSPIVAVLYLDWTQLVLRNQTLLCCDPCCKRLLLAHRVFHSLHLCYMFRLTRLHRPMEEGIVPRFNSPCAHPLEVSWNMYWYW